MKFKKLEEELPAIQDELEIIELPEPQYDSETSVEEALLGRRSVRSCKYKPIGHKLAKIVEGDKRAELSEAGYKYD